MNHPNILPLVDYQITSENRYFVSPYAEGGSLADHEGEYVGKPEDALRLIVGIAEGLSHAHSQDPVIVHRDIKPGNILLMGPDRRPVIGDFGICHVDGAERMTLLDEVVGPMLFCAPELEDGRAELVKPSSDVYSLGKLLYWLLAGKIFSREQHREERWNLRGQYGKDELEHINKLLDKMVVHNPADRFVNAGEFVLAARYVAELFRKGARAIFPGASLECDFCKQGIYKQIELEHHTQVRNFGLESVGNALWRALICDTCGNVQLFRLENAKAKKTFWGK